MRKSRNVVRTRQIPSGSSADVRMGTCNFWFCVGTEAKTLSFPPRRHSSITMTRAIFAEHKLIATRSGERRRVWPPQRCVSGR